METRSIKFVVAILIFMCVASTTQNAILYNEVATLRGEVETNAEDVYTLMSSDGARLYTIMDTVIRVFHYAKPHKKPSWACPECAEIHEKAKKEGSVSVFTLKEERAK